MFAATYSDFALFVAALFLVHEQVLEVQAVGHEAAFLVITVDAMNHHTNHLADGGVFVSILLAHFCLFARHVSASLFPLCPFPAKNEMVQTKLSWNPIIDFCRM